MAWSGVDARVIRRRVAIERSSRLTPQIVTLAETTLRPWLRVVVTHCLDLRDSFKELVDLFVRKIVQSRIEAQSG